MGINNITGKAIAKIERKITLLYKNNSRRVYAFAICLITLYIARSIPYVNLIFPKGLQVFIAIISFLLIFKIDVKYISYICIGLIILSAPVLVLGDVSSADGIGNIIYGMLFLMILKMLFASKE